MQEVDFTVDIKAGNDYELSLRMKIYEGTQRQYFTGAAAGCFKGISAVTKGFLDQISPDEENPVLRLQRVAREALD